MIFCSLEARDRTRGESVSTVKWTYWGPTRGESSQVDWGPGEGTFNKHRLGYHSYQSFSKLVNIIENLENLTDGADNCTVVVSKGLGGMFIFLHFQVNLISKLYLI